MKSTGVEEPSKKDNYDFILYIVKAWAVKKFEDYDD